MGNPIDIKKDTEKIKRFTKEFSEKNPLTSGATVSLFVIVKWTILLFVLLYGLIYLYSAVEDASRNKKRIETNAQVLSACGIKPDTPTQFVISGGQLREEVTFEFTCDLGNVDCSNQREEAVITKQKILDEWNTCRDSIYRSFDW